MTKKAYANFLLLDPAQTSRGLILLGVLGFLVRIILSAYSFGTNDTATWRYFGEVIRHQGLIELYNQGRSFNHPPLIGLFISKLAMFSDQYELFFPFVFRAPGVLADFGTGILLWMICAKNNSTLEAARVFACYGWGLIAILVSGYHGNTDCIFTFLALSSVYFAAEKRNFLISGLLLGLSVNIKIIPLVLIPALLVSTSNWKERFNFCLAFVSTCIPFFIGYFVIGDRFIENILLYTSRPEIWGVNGMFIISSDLFPEFYSSFLFLREGFQESARYLIFIFIVTVCGVTRILNNAVDKRQLYQLAAISIATLLILAPGIGVQYFVALPAFVFTFSRRWGLIFATVLGCVALSSYSYFLVNIHPLGSQHSTIFPPLVAVIGYIAWITIIVFIDRTVRKLRVQR